MKDAPETDTFSNGIVTGKTKCKARQGSMFEWTRKEIMKVIFHCIFADVNAYHCQKS